MTDYHILHFSVFFLFLLIDEFFCLAILKDWRQSTYHYPWPPASRLADLFGFPPGNVAIDRRGPLVVKLSDSLPNHVAVSESLSGQRACSNVDTTQVSLAEVF